MAISVSVCPPEPLIWKRPTTTPQILPVRQEVNTPLMPTGNTDHRIGSSSFFLNTAPCHHRLRQRPLRTAQPGYPYSLRLDVCNDGGSANPGTLDLDIPATSLAPQPGIPLPNMPEPSRWQTETSGIPDNSAAFSFPAITPGACELLQLDMLTPTSTTLNTAFLAPGQSCRQPVAIRHQTTTPRPSTA